MGRESHRLTHFHFNVDWETRLKRQINLKKKIIVQRTKSTYFEKWKTKLV